MLIGAQTKVVCVKGISGIPLLFYHLGLVCVSYTLYITLWVVFNTTNYSTIPLLILTWYQSLNPKSSLHPLPLLLPLGGAVSSPEDGHLLVVVFFE